MSIGYKIFARAIEFIKVYYLSRSYKIRPSEIKIAGAFLKGSKGRRIITKID
jgi:hypothetical protein